MNDELDKNSENMQKKLNKDTGLNQKENNFNNTMQNLNSPQNNHEDNIRKLTMDTKGHIHADKNGAAILTKNSTLFTVLGWVSAALAAFVSPFFAIMGIFFGMLLNKQANGKGNSIVITNIVLASINILFRLFFVVTMRKFMLGF